MTNLMYGSTGEEVKNLQKALGFTGSDVDGIFGSKTQQAVKDFQKNNGLTVDGIVGTNTWGVLNNTQNSAASTPTAPTTTAPVATNQPQTQTQSPAFEYTAYTPSDTVAQAEAMLEQHMSQKPGEYTSSWQTQLDDTIHKILNREKFSYDLNGDALYQQYKDQYTTQGKLAMMDTMGQAAAMTGGYGNSYAQSVGQQAYQGYLQQLNDIVPELYQLALDQYNREGDALYDQASLFAGMDDRDYGRYRDSVSDYYTDRDYYANEARYQSEQDYNKWLDDRNFGYQQHRDQVGDEQWQTTYDEGVRQYNEQFAYQKDQDNIANASRSGGSGGVADSGDSNSGGNGVYDTHGYTTDEIKSLQQAAGITADGIWGPNTQKAYDAGYRPDGTGGGPEITDTDNARLFRSSIMTSSEFARHGNRGTVNGKTYTNYKSYIEACLADWTDNDVPHGGQQLTDQEVEFLMDYYGL